METFIFAIEIIGTVAFALSGAMVAYQKRMDIFGVCVMGLVTACGGGFLRDLFLGQLPPSMFLNPVYPVTAIVVSLIAFLPGVHRALQKREDPYEQVQRLADALGLGMFTAVGISTAIYAGFYDNAFFAVFIATITGVGGGLMRDVLAGLPPSIFVRHIYALAVIAGAIVCYVLWVPLGETASTMVCFVVVVIIRLLAAKYRWSMPRAGDLEKDKTE
ncbi:MAG: trimeric intracellular cation channel family protein [Firmicutes bacterium]|nr:trimeric intracellular cation channel family protein [Bacillota bacterium]